MAEHRWHDHHLTGPAGQVVGDIRYSPFGEVEDSTGLAPAFGFTGVQQESTLGLVYLRARVYSPALGRFLTPDSLIPDVTNGQSLNAYAYVYNDPVNFTDPSGNVRVPGSLLSSIPDQFKPALVRGTQMGLDMLAWYFDEPAGCSCEGQSSVLIGHLVNGPQAAWAYLSEPAERYGHKIFEEIAEKQVPKWWRRLPLIRSLPGKWGHKTERYWRETHRVYGSLDQLQGRGMPRKNGVYPTGLDTRYTLNTRFRLKWGPKGVGGTIALAGVIDGIFQFASDAASPCFSWAQRLNRTATATVLGMAAGAVGAVFFSAAIAWTFPVWAAIGISFAAATSLSYFVLSPAKEQLFASKPELFGR